MLTTDYVSEFILIETSHTVYTPERILTILLFPQESL